jgi:hypothetical protein
MLQMFASWMLRKIGLHVHTVITIVLIVVAASCMPVLALAQASKDDCPKGYELLPGGKECTPIEWEGPIVDPVLLETPGSDLPPPVLILPTRAPDPVDPSPTPRDNETPPAPTVAPRTYATITIEGFTCPRWHMPDYTNGLIPSCGPLPGLTISIISEGVLIASGVTEGSHDDSAPAQVTFAEVPAGKVLIEQKPAPGHESLQVFCGKGGEVSLASKSSVVVEVQPGAHLSCSFVNLTAK